MIDFEKYDALTLGVPGSTETGLQEYEALRESFKTEVLRECGLADHPKKDRAFEFAWRNRAEDSGSSYVLRSARDLLVDIAELLTEP